MDESFPGEHLVKTWVATQRQLLTNWIDLLGGTTAGMPGLGVWQQTVEAWQNSVKQTLDSQTEWVREWAGSLASFQGSPEELRDHARQGQEVLQRWTEAQQQLWQGWFDMVRNLVPGTGAGAGPSAGSKAAGAGQASQNVMELWSDGARRMMELQAEWVRRLTTGR